MRIVIALLLALAGVAHAQPAPGNAVALLPLDADQKLEIYSHAVATAIANQLRAGGIDVVVVKANEAVPERARLIVDGTITPGKGEALVLAVRIRERATGATLDKLDATAPTSTNIDKAVADLAGRVLPSVKARLVAPPEIKQPDAKQPLPPPPPPPAVPKTLAITVVPDPQRSTFLEHALPDELATWATRHHWRADPAAQDAPGQLIITVIAYDAEGTELPIAHARVHVVIKDAAHATKFDRVIRTDSIVGDKNIKTDALAARAARAVLDIIEPHMRRAITGWK